jgi:hypothetical protein
MYLLNPSFYSSKAINKIGSDCKHHADNVVYENPGRKKHKFVNFCVLPEILEKYLYFLALCLLCINNDLCKSIVIFISFEL